MRPMSAPGPLAIAFPVVFRIGPLALPAHLAFESLAYFLGFHIYLALRRRWSDDLSENTRWSVLAAAAVGAAIGSRALGWLDHPAEAWAHRTDVTWLLGGKTIVGGLIGGLVAVELTKRAIGERRSTGDLYALPLCVGMAVGRVGCFLGGLPDHTYGTATSLPWGVDFGDGVRRHPTQLYEIAALGMIALWIRSARPRLFARKLERGDLFRGFLAFYLAFRIAVDVLKPEARPWLGLSGIQLAGVAGLLYYARDLPRIVLGIRSRPHG